MGGCASRPKVLRDEFDAPLPLSLPLPPAVEEDHRDKQQHEEVTKDVVVVEVAADVVVVKAESQFEDVEDVNEIPSVSTPSSQDEKQSSELVKEEFFETNEPSEVQDEIFETKEASGPSESKPQEVENPIEEQAQAVFVDVRAEPEPEEKVVDASMREAETCFEKTIEEVKEVIEVTRMDVKQPERKTTEEDLDFVDDNIPKPENETDEGSDIALDHISEPENKIIEDLDIVEDNTAKAETPVEEIIEEKQVITDEKPQEIKTEEEATTKTEQSKKPSGSKKHYWPIPSILRNPLGNFSKSK